MRGGSGFVPIHLSAVRGFGVGFWFGIGGEFLLQNLPALRKGGIVRSPEDRLVHDVSAAINSVVASLVEFNYLDTAKAIQGRRRDLSNAVINELRVRWTIIERPRKQTTLRQEA